MDSTLHIHYDADQVFYKICHALASGGYQVVDHQGKKTKFGSYSEAKEFVKANGLTLDDLYKLEEKDAGLRVVQRTVKSFFERITQSCIDQFIAQVDINNDIEDTECFYYLTGPANFRLSLYPQYKFNRKELVKPKYHSETRDLALHHWGFILKDGLEADDLTTIGHTKSLKKGYESIIISIDKDLNTVPGWHFNPNKAKLYFVSELEAARNFFTQCLTGDMTDGIPGVKGYGPVKSNEALGNCESAEEMLEIVSQVYKKTYKETWQVQLNTVMRLLWMVRDPKNYDPIYSV